MDKQSSVLKTYDTFARHDIKRCLIAEFSHTVPTGLERKTNPDGTFFWLKCRHNPEHYYNQNDSRHRASGHDEETQFSD